MDDASALLKRGFAWRILGPGAARRFAFQGGFGRDCQVRATLAAAVLALALVFSTLRFATRSQERSGTAMEETWKLEFTLDADSDRTYRVSPRLQSALEDGISFVTEGPCGWFRQK